MFNTALCHTCDHSSAIFFSDSALDVDLSPGMYVLNDDLVYKGLFWTSNMRRKKCKTFSSTFGEEALLLDGFLGDTDSCSHAEPFVQKESGLHTPPFMVISEQHDRQKDRQ